MQRVERHIILKSNINYKIIDNLSFLSKNLYNYCNYILRQNYFENKKQETKNYINEDELINRLIKENQPDYRALPSQTSQQIIKVLFKNWKSFYKSNNEFYKHPEKFKGRPNLPKFKDKIKGRNIIIFTNQGCRLKYNFIYFPKSISLQPIQTKIDRFQQVRIIPQSSCYIIEVVYNKEGKIYDLDEKLYLGIDLGINNLTTLVSNQGITPLLLNGKILKFINQYYNKKKLLFMSYIGNRGISNRIKKLELKRMNLINNYLHHISRFIVNYCLENNIKNIVVGYNNGWKQDVSMGKVGNQKFVQIPFLKLINQIQYKSEEVGINVILHEESYTSKVDHLVNEKLCKHEIYSGKRIKRGLFESSIGKVINADVNGAIGILRKVIDECFLRSIVDRGLVFRPVGFIPIKL